MKLFGLFLYPISLLHDTREAVQEDANISAAHTLNKNCDKDTMYIVNVKYRLNLKTEGSTEFITRRPWAVVPERSEGATKVLRVINYVDPSVLRFN